MRRRGEPRHASDGETGGAGVDLVGRDLRIRNYEGLQLAGGRRAGELHLSKIEQFRRAPAGMSARLFLARVWS